MYSACVLSCLPGQFQCGNKRCEKQEGLKSWEVNFAYVEQGEKRNALVKLSKPKDKLFSLIILSKRNVGVHACMCVYVRLWPSWGSCLRPGS